jgi:nucleoside-diphosphate-sugar epimerase
MIAEPGTHLNKKILVVGGAGYIGGYLVDKFLQYGGHDVTVYDALLYEDRYLKDVPFIRGDVRDRKFLTKILPDFDIIIWLAAVVGDGACARDVFLTQSINEDAVTWLVDHVSPSQKIVFTSTCSVYGKNSELLDEDSLVHPLSVYGETKLAAEQYIINNHPNHLVFRLGTLYGIGDQLSRIRLDLVTNLLTKLAVEGKTLKIFGGEQWRPLLHVRAITDAVMWALGTGTTGLFNIAEANYTIKDMAQKIVEIVGVGDIEFTEIPFEDLRDYKVSCEKLAQAGWTASSRLEEGVEQMIHVIKENRLVDPNDPIYHNEKYLQGRINPI